MILGTSYDTIQIIPMPGLLLTHVTRVMSHVNHSLPPTCPVVSADLLFRISQANAFAAPHTLYDGLPTYLPTLLPSYLPTYPPTFPPTYIPSYLPTYLPTLLPSYLPTYLSATSPAPSPGPLPCRRRRR